MSADLTPCPWPVSRLLPHGPPMIFLDEAIGYSDTVMVTAARIGPGHRFATAGGVPAHVGIELMAQTCGAYAGAHALNRGEAVKIGFLLGTRRYQSVSDTFAFGDFLLVRATLVFQDEEMGSLTAGSTVETPGK